MLRLGPEKHGKLPHILGGCEHVIFHLFIAMILSGHMWTAFTVTYGSFSSLCSIQDYDDPGQCIPRLSTQIGAGMILCSRY